ncbi:MAG: hypothetical protein IPH03_08585 [Tetrasphaera sp.]|nr:hypothetical protein [Tetrasphaera sp.]
MVRRLKYLLGDQLDAVMNYRFRKNILGFARGVGFKDNDNNGSNEIVGLTPSSFDAALASVREDYPKAATNAMMNLVDSHDTNRALYELTLLGDTGLTQAKERLKLTSLFQFAYMGAPTVYYGDEAAINAPSLANGTNGPEDDPYNRAPYPWADASGATSVYGPADASMISWYTKLAAIRKAHPSLRGAGTFTTMLLGDTTASTTDNSSYGFARTGGGETTLVLMNNGASSNTVGVPAPAAFANGKVLIDGITGATTTVSGGVVTWTLPARSGAILYLKPATVAPVAAFTTTATARGAAGSTDRSTEVWSPTPVTLTPSATDDRGIAWTELTVDGKTVRSTKADRSVTISAQGIHRVSFRAMDTSGTLSATATMTGAHRHRRPGRLGHGDRDRRDPDDRAVGHRRPVRCVRDQLPDRQWSDGRLLRAVHGARRVAGDVCRARPRRKRRPRVGAHRALIGLRAGREARHPPRARRGRIDGCRPPPPISSPPGRCPSPSAPSSAPSARRSPSRRTRSAPPSNSGT